MVMRYGMVESLGHLAYEEERAPFLGGVQVPSPREYSEQTAREIDVAVREIVKAAHDKAHAILTRDKARLARGAALLLQKETLTEEELARLT
jgi:cell division protease FtsH